MIKTFAIAAVVIILVMTIWIGVQMIWRKVFADYISDEDVMAGRTSCRNCNCMGVCALKTEQSTQK